MRTSPESNRSVKPETALFALKQSTMHRNSPTSEGFVIPEDSSHQQQTISGEHELGSPPPYTSTINHATAAKVYGPYSQTCPYLMLTIPSSAPREDGPFSDQPLDGPTSFVGNAYTREPPMSTEPADPWNKYDDTPGCCCSTTGGCCFSSRGGCCFSDTEGCCFSTTKGCCFSSDAACCFSGRGGSSLCSAKVSLILHESPGVTSC